jgi:hypothetical protein
MAAHKLNDEARTFIVQQLAMYDTPSEVAAAVKERFGIEITRQSVQEYDPTIGKRPAKKWEALFSATRKRFLEATADLGTANKAVRLRRLERMAIAAEARLHPKQRDRVRAATEILYGGAAGGGKSHLFRRAAITWCSGCPGCRSTSSAASSGPLQEPHGGADGLPDDARRRDRARRGAHHLGKNQIRFRTARTRRGDGGSVIHLCHCQHEKDVYGYQGAEIHVLIIDELTQWTRKMYTFLRSRVRLGGLKVPAWLRGLFPRILNGANPGGIGHNWVKADFVDVAPPLAITKMPEGAGRHAPAVHPGALSDNPTMAENDPSTRTGSRAFTIRRSATRCSTATGTSSPAACSTTSGARRARDQAVRDPSSWRIDRVVRLGLVEAVQRRLVGGVGRAPVTWPTARGVTSRAARSSASPSGTAASRDSRTKGSRCSPSTSRKASSSARLRWGAAARVEGLTRGPPTARSTTSRTASRSPTT